METFAKDLPITELIAQTDALMVKLGYTKSTISSEDTPWQQE